MSAEHAGPAFGGRRSRTIDEIVDEQGGASVEDVGALAMPGLFDDEAEYVEFLAFVRSLRGTGEI